MLNIVYRRFLNHLYLITLKTPQQQFVQITRPHTIFHQIKPFTLRCLKQNLAPYLYPIIRSIARSCSSETTWLVETIYIYIYIFLHALPDENTRPDFNTLHQSVKYWIFTIKTILKIDFTLENGFEMRAIAIYT